MFYLLAAAGLVALAYTMQAEHPFDWLDTHRQKMNDEKGNANLNVHAKSVMPVSHLQVASSRDPKYHTSTDHVYQRLKAQLNAEHPNREVRGHAASVMTQLNYRKGGKPGNNLRATRVH